MSETSQSILPDSRPAQIEEPILKNSKSALRRGCNWTLGCSFFLLLAFILIGWLFSAPSPQRSASLPTDFPTNIPLYKFEDRSTITYLTGAQKDNIGQRIALIPRFFYNQILKLIAPGAGLEIKNINGPITISWRAPWREIRDIIQTPVADSRLETVTLTWENLDEKKETVFNFYKKNLESQEYQIIPGLKTADALSLEFGKENTKGRLKVETVPADGVDVVLEVKYRK